MDHRAGLTEVVEPAAAFHADLRVPGDKSIAHRALLLGALATGESRLEGIPDGGDVTATVECLQALGVRLIREASSVRIRGAGLQALRSPGGVLQCANSGTTMRLLAGVLAGSRASATLVGDASLQRRPMDRVVRPLRVMGARIESHEGRAPLRIEGTALRGADHELARASAQVKSALLLAGLAASGQTSVHEPFATRDHTERLLIAMGARFDQVGTRSTVQSLDQPLQPIQLAIPGDFSSAAFLLAAAALRPGWTADVHAVGVNPTRIAFLRLLTRMGAEVDVALDPGSGLEPAGRISVTGRSLTAIVLSAAEVAAAIDEIPILLAVASQAAGLSRVTGAGELRVKESDRLAAMAAGLRQLGVKVQEGPDSMTVEGPAEIRPARVDAAGDHRIAMALAVTGLVATGPVTIEDAASVTVSYPGFFAALRAAAG